MSVKLPKFRRHTTAPEPVLEPEPFNAWIQKDTVSDSVEMCMLYICPYCANTEVVMSFYCRNCGKRLWIPERTLK